MSAVITLSWRTIRRSWRRDMPIARSVPSSRRRSKVASTSVLTIPNRDTITARASSTQRMARIWPIHSVCVVMNCDLDETSTSGNAASALSSAATSPPAPA